MGDTVVEKHYGLVKSVINKHFYTFAKINDQYEDLCQEGCIALLKAEKSFNEEEGTAKFSTYARTVIFNHLATFVKQQRIDKVQKVSLSTELTSEGEDTMEDMIGIDDDLSVLTYNQILEFLKTNMNADMIKTIQLLLEGYSQTEICELMNVKKSTLSDRLAKVRKQLSQEFNIDMNNNTTVKTNGKVIAVGTNFKKTFDNLGACHDYTNVDISAMRKICQKKKGYYRAYSSALKIYLQFEWVED